MNSKQYVIFLLCLIFISTVWPSCTGEREKNISHIRIRLVGDRMIVDDLSTASDSSHNRSGGDDHAPEDEQSDADGSHEQQDYHDRPEDDQAATIIDVPAIAINGTGVNHPEPSIWRIAIISGAKGFIGASLGIGGGLIVIDRLVERSITNEVLAKYHQSVGQLSRDDARLMHMAYCLDDAGIKSLMHEMIVHHGPSIFSADDRQWVILALIELYFDHEPTEIHFKEFGRLVNLV